MNHQFSDLSQSIIEISGKTMFQIGDHVTWRNGTKGGMLRAIIPSNYRPSSCYPYLEGVPNESKNFVLEGDYPMSQDRGLVQKAGEGNEWVAVFLSKLTADNATKGIQEKAEKV